MLKKQSKNLKNSVPPSIKQINYVSYFLRNNDSKISTSQLDIDKIIIDELMMRKMYEWDSKVKVLRDAERAYIADFAWGLKKANDFHLKNVKRHLETLLKNGFSI